MKFRIHSSKLIVAAASALLLAACNAGTPKLETTTDTLSWALGENIARSALSTPGLELDNDILLQAIRHTLDGRPQPISDTAYAQAMQFIMTTAQQQQMRQRQQKENDLQAAQQQYFQRLVADNPNVRQHPSGFYYEVLRQGKGPNAKYAQRIRFDFKSFLMLTGEPYDQTYGNRQPIVHVVGNPMFPGLIDAFQLMNAGSLYRFYFPYQLAFGENGSGNIPGYTPLIYEIELHELYEN